MRRNTKFLLLFAILVTSIMAVYFIGGCGDDTTNITVPDNTNDTTTNNNTDTTVVIEDDDEVIGSVQGIVTSAYDNSVLSGVTVTWTKNDQSFSYVTNASGYYLIDDSLSSGYYELTFTITGYTIINASVYIPTIEEIRGSTSDEAAGDEEYMETMNVSLYPMTATVTGIIYTTLPASEKDAPALATDDPDPDLVSRAAGVDVVLDYSTFLGYYYDGDYYYYNDAHFQVNKYHATTDANGVYTFTNVPLVLDQYIYDAGAKAEGQDMASADYPGGVRLLILPFTIGDSSYAYSIVPFEMNPGTTTLDDIFVPLAGADTDDWEATHNPVVLTYNFEQPGFLVDDNLVFTFSKSMDSVTFDFDLPFDFGYTWTNTYRTLTINPALDLVPDEEYNIEFYGMGKGGLGLYGGWFDEYLYTQQGMRFVTTNLDGYGATNDTVDFTDIPLDLAITLTFDMNVDLSKSTITLSDNDAGREVNTTVTGDGTQTVTITPAEDLEPWRSYDLEFQIYSTLRNDYVTDDEVASGDLDFRTLWTAMPMTAPTGFALDMGTDWVADWNTNYVEFEWNSVPGADHYEIFAMDNMANTDFIVVSGYLDNYDHLMMQGGAVDFTDASNLHQFDLYVDDGIQTPFSGGTQITFKVRAVNPLGEPGPFSAAITVGDETEPCFEADQYGNADNAGGEEDATFDVHIDPCSSPSLAAAIASFEYLGSINCSFVEAGGDPDFVLTSDAVEWTFGNDMRSVMGEVTVPAGATASADMMIINLYDNSGNMATDTIYLYPWVTITAPVDTTSTFMADEFTVEWELTDPDELYEYFDMYLSLDGGTTWFDTVFDIDATDEYYDYDVDDTLFSTTAMIGLQDTYNGGGFIWTSDVFTWAGLKLTAPDSATYDTMTTIYDAGGMDSTGIPVAFMSAGLDTVVVWYDVDGGGFTRLDTIAVTSGTTSFTWYAPDLGMDYECELAISDLDGGHPIDALGWTFYVNNDYVDVTAPLLGECVEGGATYAITWDSDFNPASSEIVVEYTLDNGTTWTTLADTVANDGAFDWPVLPTMPSNDSAWVRLASQDGDVLDMEGPFSVSGIVIDSPLVGTEWRGGTSHTILWSTVCTPGTVDLYYSHDGFVADSTLIVANTADDGTHDWSVPNEADADVWIRAFTNSDDTYTTAGPFTISGVIVTYPTTGEVVASGGTANIAWTTIGTLMDSVGIEYYKEGAGPFPIIDDLPNTGSYTWTVPNDPSDSVVIVVGKNGTFNGNDATGQFTIAGIIVTYPDGGETFTLDNAETITWDELAITGNVKIEYSINGTNWFTMFGASNIAAGTKTFNWTLNTTTDPGLAPISGGASAACLIRVSQTVGTMSDASNTPFTIQP